MKSVYFYSENSMDVSVLTWRFRCPPKTGGKKEENPNWILLFFGKRAPSAAVRKGKEAETQGRTP